MENWNPEKRRVSELKLYENNPRTISGKDMQKLKRGVEKGFHDIIKITRDGTVLSGNQRVKLLKEMNVESVWCLVPDQELTESRIKEIILESNIHGGTFVEEVYRLKNIILSEVIWLKKLKREVDEMC